MLPERLSFSLAVFASIALIYLGLIHKWDWPTTMVAMLAGILASLLVGRVAGRLSARELSKDVENVPPPPEPEDQQKKTA